MKLTNEDGSPAAAGTLTVVLKDTKPSALELFPVSAKMRHMSDALVSRAKVWYQSRTPLDKDLADVHVPRFPSRWSSLPGFFFAVQTPVANESEMLFTRLLRASCRRRGLNRVPVDDARLMDLVTAEALAALPNSNVYNADVNIDSRGNATSIDRFSDDERVLRNGDCEDMAAEVRNLAWSLRTGTWSTDEVRAAQRSVRRYIVAETFGAVALPPDPANDPYKSGRFFAHAFVMFLPASWVAKALQNGGGHAALNMDLVDLDPAARVLTQDGISLFDADALATTHPLADLRCGFRDARARRIESIGLDYYMFPCSCMVSPGTVLSTTNNTPVYELGFVTIKQYGCRYADLLHQSNDIALVPTCVLTSEENEAAQHCARFFHPVVPFDVDGGPPDLTGALEMWLAARRAPAGKVKGTKGTFFLQADDSMNEPYMLALRKKMADAKVSYTLDFFAQGEWMVQVFMD